MYFVGIEERKGDGLGALLPFKDILWWYATLNDTYCY